MSGLARWRSRPARAALCAHCHAGGPGLVRVRLELVIGPRVLCRPCCQALDAMGFGVRVLA